MRTIRPFLTAFGFAAMFVGLTVISALITSAVRGQF